MSFDLPKHIVMRPAKYIILAALVAQTRAVVAQRSWTTSAGTASISVLGTDVSKYKRTVLCADLLNIETHNDATVYAKFKFETLIGDRIMPFVSIRSTWLDAATRHVFNDYPMPAGGLQKMTATDIGGAFFFKVRTIDRDLKIVLRSSHGGGYSYTKYTHVPGQVMRLTGIRGGMFNYKKALKFGEDSHSMYRYKSADGLTDLPINDVGVFTDPQPAGQSYQPMSMSIVKCLFAGLQLRSATNTFVKVAGYGRRSNARVLDLYMDLMYAPSITISNVRDIDGNEWQLVPGDKALRRLGYRFGYSIRQSKNAGISFSNEFGLRPGAIMSKSFLSSGAYISLGCGMSLASGKYIKLGGNKKETKDEEKK